MSVAGRSGRPRERREYTIADYMAMPDDGKRYELLDGDLVQMNAPTLPHQLIIGSIHAILRAHVIRHDLGTVLLAPTDVVLRPASVCQPDVLFVSHARERVKTFANIQGAPDLAVEVLSPGRLRHDRTRKREIYERSGVAHFWLVDPMQELIEELVLEQRPRRFREGATVRGRRGTFRPAVFPRLRMSLAEVYRGVPT